MVLLTLEMYSYSYLHSKIPRNVLASQIQQSVTNFLYVPMHEV